MSSRAEVCGFYVGPFQVSLAWWRESNWQLRKLGRGRIALDFWRLSLRLEYYA